MFSQNNEEEIILRYFADCKKGTFLDLGANNGTDLSNTAALVLQGWRGCLVEPSPKAFSELEKVYDGNPSLQCINVAVSDFCGTSDFYESGTHLHKGDVSLLSSLDNNETLKWRASTQFKKIQVPVVDFAALLKMCRFKHFDMISIDCEGSDLKILRQINLSDTSLLCIEHNGDMQALKEIVEICASYGLRNELLRNMENIIISA